MLVLCLYCSCGVAYSLPFWGAFRRHIGNLFIALDRLALPRSENGVIFPENTGLDQEFILEGRDGVDLGWSSEFRQDNIRQRHCCKYSVRLYEHVPCKFPEVIALMVSNYHPTNCKIFCSLCAPTVWPVQ